jgi:hypothetical protein
MPRARSAHSRKPPNEQQGYSAWKTKAAKELNDRHHIEATAIAERIWTQFYVHRLTPKQAADRAKMVYHRAGPMTSWLNKKK